MRKREEKERKINLLELIPVRNIEWERSGEGLIVLLKPKLKNPFFARHLLPRLKNPYYKVKLDSVGSFIWQQCDGSLTVRRLADNLKDKFGEDIEPVYDRLSLFLQSLEKNCFIIYKRE